MVVMIPATVLHQPNVSMMEEGHRTMRTSVFPIMISQMPYLQRRARTVPHTVSDATLATIAVCFALIDAIVVALREVEKVTSVLALGRHE